MTVNRLTLAERNRATRTACISNPWSRAEGKRVVSTMLCLRLRSIAIADLLCHIECAG